MFKIDCIFEDIEGEKAKGKEAVIRVSRGEFFKIFVFSLEKAEKELPVALKKISEYINK